MSQAQFDLGLRLKAYHKGERVPRAGAARFKISPSPMIVAIISAPGDHSSLWGVATGVQAGRPIIFTAPDPRLWVSQVQLWDTLGKAWKGWLESHITQTTMPQFVVANTQAADRLYGSARMVATSDKVDPSTRAAARAFVIARHNSRSAGQQSILFATETFQQHYISPADPLDERHLGHWVEYPTRRATWNDPDVSLPDGADASSAPIGKAWDRMNRTASEDTREEMSTVYGQAIAVHTRKILTTRFQRLTQALQWLKANLPEPLDITEKFYMQEGSTHARLQNAERTPSTRSQRAQWNELDHRQSRLSAWQEAMYAQDPIERARGQASGDVLVASVDANNRSRAVSSQTQVRVRPGDTLNVMAGSGISVLDVERLFVASNGQIGVELSGFINHEEFVAWPADKSVRSPLPQELPWTHDLTATPQAFPDLEGNLLDQIESLVL